MEAEPNPDGAADDIDAHNSPGNDFGQEEPPPLAPWPGTVLLPT